MTREDIEVDADLANRETVRLPVQRRRPPGVRGASTQVRRGAPLAVAAMVAAAWAALLTYVPVVVLIALGGVEGAWRAGLAAWLLGHGVPLTTTTDTITLSPLLLTAVLGWRLVKAGVQTGRAIGAMRRRRLRRGIASAVAVGLAYAGLGALAALLATTPAMSIPAGRAALTCGLFATVAALTGVLLRSKAGRVRWRRLPVLITDAVRTGVVAALLVVGAGAAVVGMVLAVHAGEATEMLSSFRAGVLGQAGIVAVCLAYAPNAAAWAASYLLGPGFAVGVGTVVSNTSVAINPLPGIPIVAALPSAPASGITAGILLGLPVVAAMAAGWLLTRRRTRLAASGDEVTWQAVGGPAVLAGPVAGALLGLLAWASTGGLGANRLSELGPDPWRVCVFGSVVVGIGAVIGAVASAKVLPRRR